MDKNLLIQFTYQSSPAQECDADMAIMRYTIHKANELFDILYGHGIFIPPREALRAGSAALVVCDSFMHL